LAGGVQAAADGPAVTLNAAGAGCELRYVNDFGKHRVDPPPAADSEGGSEGEEDGAEDEPEEGEGEEEGEPNVQAVQVRAPASNPGCGTRYDPRGKVTVQFLRSPILRV
jgi:hypothetical protein